ncbi:MAG TPA: flagellar biosynthetic protein FliO [Aquabacterium sp.]|uniref:FliO/MopB family protein n=1 Tax=Aquabacterium sp. TaxID=1872578 RepID=UPI002E2EC76E|nr:flagellar biosynthetic protein FliO [Aquabacterium sp.]HEX5356456.1 flagellar biosynthetic protein FliO [Aquabacterium sp.]
MPSTGLTVVWFLGVVALIPLTLWVLKRSGLATGTVGGATAMIKPVGQLNIGPGQRLVTVEVGTGDSRTWLVLGVTAQHINTLHTMAPQNAPLAEQATPSFTNLLRRSLGQQDKGQA